MESSHFQLNCCSIPPERRVWVGQVEPSFRTEIYESVRERGDLYCIWSGWSFSLREKVHTKRRSYSLSDAFPCSWEGVAFHSPSLFLSVWSPLSTVNLDFGFAQFWLWRLVITRNMDVRIFWTNRCSYSVLIMKGFPHSKTIPVATLGSTTHTFIADTSHPLHHSATLPGRHFKSSN